MDFQVYEVAEVNGLVRVTVEKSEVMGLKDLAISAAAHHLTETGLGDVELVTIEEDTTDFFLYYETDNS